MQVMELDAAAEAMETIILPAAQPQAAPQTAAPPLEEGARPVIETVTLHAGEKIGDVRVLALSQRSIELRTPGHLGPALGLVGAVPIIWCALAWMMCLREGLLVERLPGCLTLTVMAVVSGALMISSLGIAWRFDGRRRQIIRRVGPIPRRHNARAIAGLRTRTSLVGMAGFADQMLTMDLVDATGATVLNIGEWNRRGVDRAKVEALATAIRNAMQWEAPAGALGAAA